MSYQTNNYSWKAGYNGQNLPNNATSQQIYDHQRGVQQKALEVQKAYEAAWKKNS